MTVPLRGPGLEESQVVDVARHGEKVALAAAARTRMERSRNRVERAAGSREPVYGVAPGGVWRRRTPVRACPASGAAAASNPFARRGDRAAGRWRGGSSDDAAAR